MSFPAAVVSRLPFVQRFVPARVRPTGVALALIALVVFKLAISDGGRDPQSLALAQTVALILLATLIAIGAVHRTALTYSLLGMIVAIAVTSLWSVRPEASVRELALWTMYVGIGTVIASTLSSTAAVQRFLDALVAVAGWLCLIALFMFWGANNPGMRWYATFYWPNPFAGFLLLVLPLTLLRFLCASRTRGAVVHGLMMLLLAVSLVLTYSRGAWLAMAAVTPFALMFLRPVRWGRVAGRSVVLAALTAAAVFALARGAPLPATGQGIGERARSVVDPTDYSIQARLHFWRAGLAMFADHPVIGTGPGTFGSVHAAYQRDVRYYARDAHSLPIQVMAEMGVIGLAALVGLLAVVGRTWLRALRAARGAEEYPLIAGLGLGLLAFFLHSALDMDWMFPANPAMAFALAGVPAWYDPTHRAGPGVPGSRWIRVMGVTAVLIALGTTGGLWIAERNFMRGQQAAARGEWSRAAQYHAAAVRGNPLSARYRDAYAVALLRMPDPRFDAAAAALRRAMRLDRMNAALPFRLAVILTAGAPATSGQQEAEILLRHALVLDRLNRPEIYRALAGLYRRQGRLDEAAEVYRTAMPLYVGRHLRQEVSLDPVLWPEIVTLFREAADLEVRRGRVASATRILEHLLTEDPHNPDLIKALDVLR